MLEQIKYYLGVMFYNFRLEILKELEYAIYGEKPQSGTEQSCAKAADRGGGSRKEYGEAGGNGNRPAYQESKGGHRKSGEYHQYAEQEHDEYT